MKRYLISLIAVFIFCSTIAQPCFPDGIVFKTQEALNQFPIDNPNCTIIEGDLAIEGFWIDDLSPLSNIIEIQGNFTHYYNAYLYDFIGLENLTKVGGTFRVANSKIQQFIGLEHLESIGGNFELEMNNSWLNLNGLEKLKSIGGNLILGEDGYKGNPYLHSIEGLMNVEKIGGHLKIYGSDSLKDLTGLEKIDSVFGNIIIGSTTGPMPSLKSLDGLDNLTFVGGRFEIDSCSVLQDITALSNIKEIQGKLIFWRIDSLKDISALGQLENLGALEMFRLPVLQNLEGLEKIETLEELSLFYLDSLSSLVGLNNLNFVEKRVKIWDMYALTSLDGLHSLKNIGGDLSIEYNYVLENFQDLENLETVGGDVSFYRIYKIQDLSDFKALHFIGGELDVSRMHGLKSLEGMSKLETISGLYISYNESLISFDGLENVQLIDEWSYIYINDNPSLLDITAIQNLDPQNIQSISINDNLMLSNCAIESICTLLTIPGANIVIENNAAGCLSNEEVDDICTPSGIEPLSIINLSIYPNPATDWIYFETEPVRFIQHINLYTTQGELVRTKYGINDKLSVGNLDAGMYYLQLGFQDHSRSIVKIVIMD